jgi:lipopolysaccharide export system permease protein
MSILTRYILREFAKPFLLSVCLFTLLVLIVQVFNDIHFIMEFKPGFWSTSKYFFFMVPGFSVQAIPISVLFGVLLSLSMLSKSSELIAMRAGGVSIFRVAIPLTCCGAVVCLFSIFMNETVVPRSSKMVRHTKVVEIQKQPEQFVSMQRQNISMVGSGNQIYHIGSFDGAAGTMTNVLLLGFDNDSKLISRVDARSARYQDGRWTFFNGYLRTFDDSDREVSAQPFREMPISLPEKPVDFLKMQKEPEEMTLIELLKYVRQLEKNGSDDHKELVELHHKIVVPFGCLIMAVLGVPWGWSMGKHSGVVISILICVLVAFIYLGGLEIARGLGNQGILSPFLSMWLINMIFCVLGPVLLLRKDR